MAKTTIIAEGVNATATFNSVALTNLNTIEFNFQGEGAEIDLTTLDDGVKVKQISQQREWGDITINKKSESTDFALTSANATLVITYREVSGNTKTLTYWAQIKSNGGSSLEAGATSNHDLVFTVTNLNGSYATTIPTLTST